MTVKLGEIQAKMSANASKTDDLNVHLRLRRLDILELVRFKPGEDLKKGDLIKITIEKVEVPAPPQKPEAPASP